jgi:hypothetical protein
MRLFEFNDNDPLRIKLVAVADQLASRDGPISTDEFLSLLNKHKISLTKSDLFDIVKKDPLKNIIADVNSNEVTFKGTDGDEIDNGNTIDDNEKIRQQMANKALK